MDLDSYDKEDMVNKIERNEGKSTKGTFGNAIRKLNSLDTKNLNQNTSVRDYRLPGEFPKVYNAKEIATYQKNERIMKRRIPSCVEKLDLKLDHGPGSYNTDKDVRSLFLN